MTEAEWFRAGNAETMLAFLGARISDRKRRLWACACCRRHWHWVEDTEAVRAVEVAEAFADGRATVKKLVAAKKKADEVAGLYFADYRQTGGVEPYIAHMHASACSTAATEPPGVAYAALAANFAAQTYAHEVMNSAATVTDQWHAHRNEEAAAQAGVLREIVGNPSCLIELRQGWRTTDVRLLAEGIYAERAFDRLPILADALQDAGCTAETLLAHLRDPSLLPGSAETAAGPPPVEHVRGCWALDLVLGLS